MRNSSSLLLAALIGFSSMAPALGEEKSIWANPGTVQADGQDFTVGGTPDKWHLKSVDEPKKAATCLPPKALYRTDKCIHNANGTNACEMGCGYPPGTRHDYTIEVGQKI
jgi:hypothetical protein